MKNTHYKEQFEIEYHHPKEVSQSGKNRLVPGLFKITLADKVLLTPDGQEYHETDYMFQPDSILDCATSIGIGVKDELKFNPENRKFCLHFTPINRDLVRLTEETTSETQIELPIEFVVKKLVDCYKDCCRKTNIPINQEMLDEYKRFLE